MLERTTPSKNRSELYSRLIKEAIRKDMRESNSPIDLWDYAIESRALVHNTFFILSSKIKEKRLMNAIFFNQSKISNS